MPADGRVAALLDALLVGDEDAEGVAIEVFADTQRSIRIAGAIESQRPPKGEYALVHRLPRVRVADRQIQVEILRPQRSSTRYS